jgi:hypothetical protein
VADKETRLGAVTFSWRGQAIENAVRDGVWAGLLEAGVVLKKSMTTTLSVKGGFGNRSTPGEPPRKDNNVLAGSIMAVPDHAAKVVRVGTIVPHGRYMEFGANIRPKKGKTLPVPINAAAAKMLRKDAVRLGGLKTQNMTVIRTRTGALYLVETTAKTGKIKKNGAKFKLVKSVRILPRPWVRRSYLKARKEMQNVFTTAVAQAIRKAATK